MIHELLIFAMITPELAQVVHRTLRFDPAERYQTARELYEALSDLLPQRNIAIIEAMLTPMTAEARAVKAEVAEIPVAIPLARSGGRTSIAGSPYSPGQYLFAHGASGRSGEGISKSAFD